METVIIQLLNGNRRLADEKEKKWRFLINYVASVFRGKYLSLFPAPVQGKVFNFEIFWEEFWGSKPEK